jgi:signal transduction histidine kinase
MNAVIDDTIAAVKRISSDLRPGILDDLGLVAALEWYTGEFRRRSGVQCPFSARGDERLVSEETRTAMYRVCQEALTNVARHAGARTAAVSLTLGGERLRLEVADDGVGIEPERVDDPHSLGLTGMRERMRAIGGTLTVVGQAGQGTVVSAEAPVSGLAQGEGA